jgi:hypothetical protein
MEVVDTDEPEEPFDTLLAKCHEALAAGRPLPALDESLPTELRHRLEQDVAVLRRLQQALSAPPPGGAGRGRVGRFELRRELGRGGFGVVFLAWDPLLHREVALKVPHLKSLLTPEAQRRFLGEARAAAGLDHPNVVPVHEAGEAGGVCYIASAYCEGVTLADWLRDQAGPVPARDAAALVATLAEAVAYVHGRNVWHRDLKPSNILLQRTATSPTAWRGFTPRLTDFGLAKTTEGAAGLTRSGTVQGTLLYMAPEQAEGRIADIGPATDVWALGAILYELLTGRPPFKQESQPAVLHAICYDEPVSPSQLRPDVPLALAAVCLRCLRKKPAERYSAAADLAAALRSWLAAETGPALARGSAEAPRHRWITAPRPHHLAAVLLLAGLLGLGAWALTRPGNQHPSPGVPGTPNATAAKPLKVRLRVVRIPEGRPGEPPHELGEGVFSARLNDKAEPAAELSEPAYAYLLAFNPAEKTADLEQYLPETREREPPQKSDKVDPDVRITLSDGVGLQAFAVVASRLPLPAYAEWRKRRPAAPWQRTQAKPGVVMRCDGVSSFQELFGAGVSRGPQERAEDRLAIKNLARWLRDLPDVEAVEVVGFAVERAD